MIFGMKSRLLTQLIVTLCFNNADYLMTKERVYNKANERSFKLFGVLD
jgi:hypothetical protein